MQPNSLELRRRGNPTGQEFQYQNPAPSPANHAASPVASSEWLCGTQSSEPSISNQICNTSVGTDALEDQREIPKNMAPRMAGRMFIDSCADTEIGGLTSLL